MVKISMQHGTSGASAHAYSYWAAMLGHIFRRYGDAQRFAKLACDLVEKHGFNRVPCEGLLRDGNGCLLDAADRDIDRFHARGRSRRD